MELDPDAYIVESGVNAAAVERVNRMFEERPGMLDVLGLPRDPLTLPINSDIAADLGVHVVESLRTLPDDPVSAI